MIDVTTFLLMLLYTFGSILLITLIVLVVKMIHTVDRVNGLIDELNLKINKLDHAFRVVDLVTDNMALLSDKIVDVMSNFIRKVFSKKTNRKEEISDEQQ